MGSRPSRVESVRPRMLVVDDDYSVLRVTTRLGESLGFEAIGFSSPMGALALITGGERFAILVTDVDMPVLRGPELAARIADEGIELPTLFVSGGTTALATLPNQRSLEKPFSLDELAREIEALGVPVPRRRR